MFGIPSLRNNQNNTSTLFLQLITLHQPALLLVIASQDHIIETTAKGGGEPCVPQPSSLTVATFTDLGFHTFFLYRRLTTLFPLSAIFTHGGPRTAKQWCSEQNISQPPNGSAPPSHTLPVAGSPLCNAPQRL